MLSSVGVRARCNYWPGRQCYRFRISMPATTARAAATGIEVVGAWDAPQFKSLRDVSIHRFLDLVHLLLRIDESAGHRIVEQRFAIRLETAELFPVERQARLLFSLERFALLHYRL